MYVPKEYQSDSHLQVLELIKEFPLGSLISALNGSIRITLLPFVFENDDCTCLVSHFALANDHWKELDGQSVKIMFQGPSAYISPTHYQKENSVPTWNYVAVEVSGVAEILKENEDKLNVLNFTISHLEPEWLPQWQKIMPDYGSRLLPGIVAVRIRISELTGNLKLSQDKPLEIQKRVAENLNRTGKMAASVGDLMSRNLGIIPEAEK